MRLFSQATAESFPEAKFLGNFTAYTFLCCKHCLCKWYWNIWCYVIYRHRITVGSLIWNTRFLKGFSIDARFVLSIDASASSLHVMPWHCTGIACKSVLWPVRQRASWQIRTIAGCACAGNARNVFPAPRLSDPDMHHVTHVPWCMPGSLNGFLWSRWRGKRPRHSQRMRNLQFYVSGKRPMSLINGSKLNWKCQELDTSSRGFIKCFLVLSWPLHAWWFRLSHMSQMCNMERSFMSISDFLLHNERARRK